MKYTTKLAEIAYNGYRNHTRGVSLATGQPIPEWAGLKPEIQAAWEASASAVGKEISFFIGSLAHIEETIEQ